MKTRKSASVFSSSFPFPESPRSGGLGGEIFRNSVIASGELAPREPVSGGCGGG
ncbi:hypothetical protein A2U01_0114669, partial [Trifolium medium]|nr:hypothetical protein [Trifolium medium]